MLGGSNIPLPNNQQLNDVTVNSANDTFTVQQSGTYEIEYAIHLTVSLLVSTRINKNGVPLPASDIATTTAKNSFTKKCTVVLTAGDTMSLQLYGLLGAAFLS